MKSKRVAKKSLTNACKRWILTLGDVMIKVKGPHGIDIECDTPDEAMEMLRRLSEERQEEYEFLQQSVELPAGTKRSHLWRVKTFQRFIEALGRPQIIALKELVQRVRVKDEELRNAVHVKSNQQLAGVLSGISKQAAALNIPARSIYTIENERQSGKVEKTYVVAADFWRMADKMNWPE